MPIFSALKSHLTRVGWLKGYYRAQGKPPNLIIENGKSPVLGFIECRSGLWSSHPHCEAASAALTLSVGLIQAYSSLSDVDLSPCFLPYHGASCAPKQKNHELPKWAIFPYPIRIFMTLSANNTDCSVTIKQKNGMFFTSGKMWSFLCTFLHLITFPLIFLWKMKHVKTTTTSLHLTHKSHCSSSTPSISQSEAILPCIHCLEISWEWITSINVQICPSRASFSVRSYIHWWNQHFN